jgi:hypothetical protein
VGQLVIQTNKPNLSRRSSERNRIKANNQSSLITNHFEGKANSNSTPAEKKFCDPDNIKNNIYRIAPYKPVRRDMRTSVNKVSNSIENIIFQNIPEKDTVHAGHNEYFHYPFRINKQGKHYREPVSLIKE